VFKKGEKVKVFEGSRRTGVKNEEYGPKVGSILRRGILRKKRKRKKKGTYFACPSTQKPNRQKEVNHQEGTIWGCGEGNRS